MARRFGGPLLCVGDLLSDLSHEEEDDQHYHDAQKPPPSTLSQSPQSLHEIFQRNYDDLNVALTNSGHSWTGLTQKVCTALKAADKLVQTSHEELGQLAEKVHTLESILKRGEEACQRFKVVNEEQKGLS